MDWAWAKGQDLVWGEGRTQGESYVVLLRAWLLDLVAVHEAMRSSGTNAEVRTRIPESHLAGFDRHAMGDDVEAFSPPGTYLDDLDWPDAPNALMQAWAPGDFITTFGFVTHDMWGATWAVLHSMEELVPFSKRAGATIEHEEELVVRAFGFDRG